MALGPGVELRVWGSRKGLTGQDISPITGCLTTLRPLHQSPVVSPPSGPFATLRRLHQSPVVSPITGDFTNPAASSHGQTTGFFTSLRTLRGQRAKTRRGSIVGNTAHPNERLTSGRLHDLMKQLLPSSKINNSKYRNGHTNGLSSK